MRGSRKLFLMGAPAWVLPGASLDMDFANDRYWCGSVKRLGDIATITRASTKYVQWNNGLWLPVSSGIIGRSDQGALPEQAATNLALWCRDLTNANWTASNVTVTKTATGIDGVANSASLLTATGSNGTVTAAAITSGSASRSCSMFVQRVSGTGAISISQDGGSTYIAITTKVGAAWYRPTPTDFSGLTQTVTNPQIVIKMATSGDAINVDFVDLEAGSFLTSPIATTSASVTRSADVITLIGAASTAALNAKAMRFETNLGAGIVTNARAITFNGGSTIFYPNTSSIQTSDGTNAAAAGLGSGSYSGLVKSAFGLDNTSMTAIANGGSKTTQSTSAWATNATGTVTLGNRSAGDRALNGYLRRCTFGPVKGQFDGLTA